MTLTFQSLKMCSFNKSKYGRGVNIIAVENIKLI